MEGLLECHSGNCELHSPICYPIQTEYPQRFLESRKQAEIARGQIRTIRGVALRQFACWPGKPSQFWWYVVECYHGARSTDASTSASSFKYAAAIVAIPHSNTPHRFSLS